MKTLSPDTSQSAEKVLVDLISKAPVYKRIDIVSSLIKTTRYLSWQAICDRYSGETEEKRTMRFITLLYGDETLAQRVTDMLSKAGAE